MLVWGSQIVAGMVTKFVSCHSVFDMPPLSGNFNMMSLENQGTFHKQFPVGTLQWENSLGYTGPRNCHSFSLCIALHECTVIFMNGIAKWILYVYYTDLLVFMFASVCIRLTDIVTSLAVQALTLSKTLLNVTKTCFAFVKGCPSHTIPSEPRVTKLDPLSKILDPPLDL